MNTQTGNPIPTTVDRSVSKMEAILSTNCTVSYMDEQALAAFPEFEDENPEFDLVSLDSGTNIVDRDQVDVIALSKTGRKHRPDVLALCAMVKADLTLIDAGPLVIQCQDLSGRYSHLIFYKWGSDYLVGVSRRHDILGSRVRVPVARE